MSKFLVVVCVMVYSSGFSRNSQTISFNFRFASTWYNFIKWNCHTFYDIFYEIVRSSLIWCIQFECETKISLSLSLPLSFQEFGTNASQLQCDLVFSFSTRKMKTQFEYETSSLDSTLNIRKTFRFYILNRIIS